MRLDVTGMILAGLLFALWIVCMSISAVEIMNRDYLTSLFFWMLGWFVFLVGLWAVYKMKERP